MPRFAAIAFSGLALEIARQRLSSEKAQEKDAPLAIVVARRGGAVQGERSLLGNTRLHEVSKEARTFGIRQGQTIASAKAKHGGLRVRVVEPSAVEAALVTVAEMGLAFGATTAFEAGGEAGDVVWVDVTGCAHLHARADDPAGERALSEALVRAVTAMGHACRVAIADGAKVAAAVARFASREVTVVPLFGNARAMGRLPLAALGLSSPALSWLSKVGAQKAADLQRLPRSALATRLGKEAPRVMALLEGDDRAPLSPHVPPDKPLERAVLEYGITHHEALFFVIKGLCDRLGARLLGRVKKASKLLLRLEVDHAVSGAPEREPTLPLTLASPLCKADELFAVVRAKVESPDGAARIAIEREENGTMDVPILAVSLEVTEEVSVTASTTQLFVREARAERVLPRLVAELSAELGAHAVGVLSVVDTWITAERSKLVPYEALARSPGGMGQGGKEDLSSLVSAGEEMTRLLPVPKAVSRGALVHPRLVSRSEQIEWWKAGTGAHDELVAFWEERAGGKAAGHGMAWVSVDRRTGAASLRGWVD